VTISELGSLGELIAAIATLATLAYLALQIRRSNTVALAESQRFAAATPATIAIAQDAGLARIFAQGLGDRGSLNGDELIRFDMILANLMGSISSSTVDQITFGFYRGDLVPDQTSSVRMFLSTPGGAAWWDLYRSTFPPAFQRFVKDEARPNPPAAAQQGDEVGH